MADKKISELTELTTPDGTEELVVNDSGVSKKITQANLLRGINNTAADATAITIDASENVGIGTNSPDTKLHVDGGDVKISSDVQSSNGDGIPTIFFGEDTTALVAAQISYHGDDESGDNNFIGIGCNGATPASEAVTKENHQMVIKASGNIGIGTSSPDHTLRVNGDTRLGNLHVKTSEYTGGTGKSIWADNAGTGVLGLNSSTSIQMNAGGSERMSIDSSGNVEVKTGNLVIGTSGKGIDFSATSDGSGTMTSEVLDDYEEGTWTPTGVGLTLTSPTGYYTKVGRLVTVNWLFVYPTTSSGSQTSIAGLPFTVGAGYINGGNHGYVNGSASVSIAHITATTTSLLYRTANGGVSLTHADLSGATIRGSMTYQV